MAGDLWHGLVGEDIVHVFGVEVAGHGTKAFQRFVLITVGVGFDVFEDLPVSGRTGIDVRYWTTPHGLTFAGAAQLFGLPYASAASRPELQAALDAAHARPGVSLIEVSVAPDSARRSLVRVRAELEQAFAEIGADGGP